MFHLWVSVGVGCAQVRGKGCINLCIGRGKPVQGPARACASAVEKASHPKGKLFENLRKRPNTRGKPVYSLLKKALAWRKSLLISCGYDASRTCRGCCHLLNACEPNGSPAESLVCLVRSLSPEPSNRLGIIPLWSSGAASPPR